MDKEKLEDLLLNEMLIIYKYLLKIGCNKEDAEDIVQETLIKAIEYLDAVDEQKIMAWLFKVAINNYYNLYRKKKHKEIEFDETVLSNLTSDNLVEQQIMSDELNKNVKIVLNSLKDSYKNLIIFKYFMDLSYTEIASLLGLDESKVKTYLYRARIKFKSIWEELNYD